MIRIDVSQVAKTAKQIRKQAPKALNGLALKTAEHLSREARERSPTDTGLLKASWEAQETGVLTAIVKNPTHYASFVEFGTRFMDGQKFLTTAIAETEEALPKIVAEHLKEQAGRWFGA